MSAKQHPLIAYFVLTFAFTWGIVGLIKLGILPLTVGFLIATFGPTVGAAVVTSLSREPGAVRRWLSGYGRWRASPLAYLVALSPLLTVAIGVGISGLMPGDSPVPEATLSAGFLASALISSLLIGPVGEEGGWRGFAFPRLQRQFGALVGSLILGVIWVVWHLPVWLLPDTPMAEDPFLPWAIFCLAFTIVITVAYNLSGGSILVTIIAHLAANFSTATALGLGWLSVARYFAVIPWLYVLLAVILIITLGPSRLGASAGKTTKG